MIKIQQQRLFADWQGKAMIGLVSNKKWKYDQRIEREAYMMDDWLPLLKCYPIPQICSVKRWFSRDEVSTKKL